MIARAGRSSPDTEKPSSRHATSPGTPLVTALSASRSAARLVLCRPRSSIPRTQRLTTATRAALRSTSGKSSSRASQVCCLESLSVRNARISRVLIAS